MSYEPYDATMEALSRTLHNPDSTVRRAFVDGWAVLGETLRQPGHPDNTEALGMAHQALGRVSVGAAGKHAAHVFQAGHTMASWEIIEAHAAGEPLDGQVRARALAQTAIILESTTRGRKSQDMTAAQIVASRVALTGMLLLRPVTPNAERLAYPIPAPTHLLGGAPVDAFTGATTAQLYAVRPAIARDARQVSSAVAVATVGTRRQNQPSPCTGSRGVLFMRTDQMITGIASRFPRLLHEAQEASGGGPAMARWLVQAAVNRLTGQSSGPHVPETFLDVAAQCLQREVRAFDPHAGTSQMARHTAPRRHAPRVR